MTAKFMRLDKLMIETIQVEKSKEKNLKPSVRGIGVWEEVKDWAKETDHITGSQRPIRN